MNKTLVTVVLIVLLAAFFQGRNNDQRQRLELYQQIEEGKVAMVGEVTDEHAIKAYLDLYDQLSFTLEPITLGYPDVAIYRHDSNGTIHHTNVWLTDDDESYVQQIKDGRKMALLSEEEINRLKGILPGFE